MRKFIKKIKNSIWGKILKCIFKVAWWLIEAIIIFIAIIIVTQRVTNNEKAFLGFRIFNVATGSMEPEYAVGDILISKEIEPEKIKVGDNIVYLGEESGYAGKIITHNVIEIEQDENGDYLFHTKGRANTVEDPIVHEKQLYGTIVQNNVVLAWLCRILTNRYGLYFFVIVPIVLYFFVEFVKSQSEKIEQERELERERKRIQEEKRARRERKERRQQRELKRRDVQEEIQEEIVEEVKTPKKPKDKQKTSKVENVETRKTKTQKAPKSEEPEPKAKKKVQKTENIVSEEKKAVRKRKTKEE